MNNICSEAKRMNAFTPSIVYNKSHVRKSIFWLIGLILLGSVMVYGLNNQLARTAYFLIVLTFLLRSKDKVLVTVVLFALMLYPVKMFYSGPHNWIVPISSTVGIEYYYAFAIGFFVKYFNSIRFRMSLIKDHFQSFYKPFIVYFFVLVFLGFFFGHNLRSYHQLLISALILLLFWVFPRMLNAKEMAQFNRIIFVWTIILAFVSIAEIALKGQILETLVFGRDTRRHLIDAGDGLSRVGVGVRVMFYSIAIATYYLITGKKGFKVSYLWFVIIMAFIAIINTASRGWMLGALFIVIVASVYYFRNTIINFKVLLIGGLILIILILFLPSNIKQNMSFAFDRFSTLESVAEGDMTGEGTISRWNERGPRALTRFDESPVFGFGFSKVSAQYFDHHVGNHSLLITSGILGLVIIWFTVTAMVLYIFRLEKKHRSLNGIFVFGIIIMAMMLIHSSNEIMISYYKTPSDAVILWVLFLNNVNARLDLVKRLGLTA